LQVQTAIGRKPGRSSTVVATIAPARDSRFIAFNKKYLNGSDGHYYLRDLGQLVSDPSGNGTGVTPEAAFDFQPYIKMGDVVSDGERVEVPHEHRARTPPASD
jgi:hypothetical protein